MPNHNRVTLPNLPLIESQSVTDEGHFVVVDERQWARFEDYEDAARCCATLSAQAIRKLAA